MAKGTTKTTVTTNEEERELVIERIIDAPRELVWKAWTDPEMVKKWWGPEGFTAPSIKIDLRVDGKYIFCMHGPAGSQWDKDMYSAGLYKEIVPNEKLVVTDYFSDKDGNMLNPADYGQDPNFPIETTVTVLFEEIAGGKTKLSIIYPLPESATAREAMLKSGMNEGWNQSLDKLAEALRGKIDQKVWIATLRQQGFSDVRVCPLPPNPESDEHTHDQHTVHVILSGELTIIDASGTQTYRRGDRVDFPAGTTHRARGSASGGEMIIGVK